MTIATSRARTAFLCITTTMVLACNNSNAPLTGNAADPLMIGSINIAVSTTSEDDYVDLDGYTIEIDAGRLIQPVGINDTLNIAALKGVHLVRLSGIALNCSTSATDRWIDVADDKTAARVSFSVTCGNYWDY